jgi:undecaprenyl diphosphate synthase
VLCFSSGMCGRLLRRDNALESEIKIQRKQTMMMNEPATMPVINEGGGNDWMSRAELMISQLFAVDGLAINDDDEEDDDGAGEIRRRRRHDDDAGGSNDYLWTPQLPENRSAPSSSAAECIAYSHHHHNRHRRRSRDCSASHEGMLGGGMGECAFRGGGGGPCASLLLSRAKPILGSAIRAYLSSPIWLALLPLAMGVVIGYLAGNGRGGRRRSGEHRGGRLGPMNDTSNDATDVDHDGSGMRSSSSGKIVDKSLVGTFPSRLYHRLSLRMLLVAAYLDPRRSPLNEDERDDEARDELRKKIEVEGESGVDPSDVPRHVAVIMDGNRRYGKARYGNATSGHYDGSRTLIEFSKWCISEGIRVLTVYAFSTENWDRDPIEINALMSIFCKYCDELRVEAVNRGIRIRVLTTECDRIPENVRAGIDRMVMETERCDKFLMNICLSYGGRGEIVNACRSIANDVRLGTFDVDDVDEIMVRNRMLTSHCSDPDVVIRTSGEERLSNFLLWQVAYSEFFFLKKHWPELRKKDLLEVIRTFARGRKRRYGK